MSQSPRKTFGRYPSALRLGLLVSSVVLSSCDESSEVDPRTAVDLAEVLAFPAVDEITAIRDVMPTAGGGFWILNTNDPLLTLQGRDGTVVAQFGAYGDAPNDLGLGTPALVAASDSGVTVLDRGRRAIRQFNTDGSEVEATDVPQIETNGAPNLNEQGFGDPYRAIPVRGQVVTGHYPEFRRTGGPHIVWNGQIAGFDLSTGEMTILVDFRNALERYTDRARGAMLAPIPLWAVCPEGDVAVYLPFADSISWVQDARPPSRVERTVGVLTIQEVGPTIVEAVFRNAPPQTQGMSRADIQAMLPMILEETGGDISDQAPAYAGLMCDLESRLWLEHFALEDHWAGRGRTWEILDYAGAIVSTVRLPAGFRPIRFVDDLLVGALEDSLGLQRLAAVSVARVTGRR